MENSDGLLNKVKKLLALASSANEHEAKIAAEKAQELMLRHNLSMQEITLSDEDYAEIEILSVCGINKAQNLIINILQKHFFVKAILSYNPISYTGNKRNPHIKIVFYGTKANIEVAKYVFEYLKSTYARLWRDYKKQNSALTERYRYSYHLGLTRGINANLEALKTKVQDEMGLVVIEDPMLKKRVENIKPRKDSPLPVDQQVIDDGKTEGSKIKISRALSDESLEKGKVLGYNSKVS